MELIINRSEGNKVYLFEDGLVELVWEPEPITRFKLKELANNDFVKEQIALNKPTAGIIFEGQPYIGTNDGMIYGPKGKIQRVPFIHVDKGAFLDEYPFTDDEERSAFTRVVHEGLSETIDEIKGPLRRRVFDILEIYNDVHVQSGNIDRYLMYWLGIQGFVTDKKPHSMEPERLYDGSLLGITDTEYNKVITQIVPEALYQLKDTGAFVPCGGPGGSSIRIEIENGIQKRTELLCVDYRSLWDVTGKYRLITDICPRDGSGYKAATFASDGEIVAISHGNHPWYELNIQKLERGGVRQDIKKIDLDPSKLPDKLLIVDGCVIGDYGDVIRNFSKETDIYKVDGAITSITDSGLVTVKGDGKTSVINPFTEREIVLEGDYRFLNRTMR